jgi:steroid 5-alpha reductase family enzyme
VAPLNDFLLGAVALSCALAALFFVRFWRNTTDRLFAWFAATFALLAMHWTLVALTDPTDEHRPLLYLIRLAAFAIVLVAIAGKNRRGS